MTDTLHFSDIPSIADVIREKITEEICQQLGFESLPKLATELHLLRECFGELNRSIEAIHSSVDTKISAALKNPELIRQLAIMVSAQNRVHRQNVEQERREQLRQILTDLTGMEVSQTDALVERADADRVVANKAQADWPEAVKCWLDDRTEAMIKVITGMVNTKKAKDLDYVAFAKYFLTCGLSPENPAAVLEAMRNDSNFEGLIKKAS